MAAKPGIIPAWFAPWKIWPISKSARKLNVTPDNHGDGHRFFDRLGTK
jgi:hypothetical protein